MFLFEQKLQQAGIADTRTEHIAKALSDLHSAISSCDISTRRVFADMHPYAVRAAVEYAKVEDLNTYLWGVSDIPEWLDQHLEYETECRIGPLTNNVVDMGDFR